MATEINNNLGRIIQAIENKGMKLTKIASEIGYTSTSQMYNTIEGRSLLSTKAILRLIENLDVDPSYIFFGKGRMFLSEETELEKLQRENHKLTQNHNEVVKTVIKLNEINKKLEQRNDDLIEISKGVLRNFSGGHDTGKDTNEEKILVK